MVCMMKKIVVFGGSFSPPTRAHVEIIRMCLQLPSVDEVWLLPSGDRTDKTISSAAKHQLAMLRLLVDSEFGSDTRLRVITTELERSIATETYDTYQEFLQEHPDTDFWFVYGSDSYATIRDWLNGGWLAQNLPVMIVPRNSVPLPPKNTHVKHLPALPRAVAPISSTKVRSTLSSNTNISSLVPPCIADYLEDNRIF